MAAGQDEPDGHAYPLGRAWVPLRLSPDGGILSAQPFLLPYWVNRIFAGWSWHRQCLGAYGPGLAGLPGLHDGGDP